jgi:hypothetical protein
MAEGNEHIVNATSNGINEAIEKFKDSIVEKVDPQHIQNWFNQDVNKTVYTTLKVLRTGHNK